MLKVFKGLLDKTGSAEICLIRWERSAQNQMSLQKVVPLKTLQHVATVYKKEFMYVSLKINQARQNHFTLGNKE